MYICKKIKKITGMLYIPVINSYHKSILLSLILELFKGLKALTFS